MLNRAEHEKSFITLGPGHPACLRSMSRTNLIFRWRIESTNIQINNNNNNNNNNNQSTNSHEQLIGLSQGAIAQLHSHIETHTRRKQNITLIMDRQTHMIWLVVLLFYVHGKHLR